MKLGGRECRLSRQFSTRRARAVLASGGSGFPAAIGPSLQPNRRENITHALIWCGAVAQMGCSAAISRRHGGWRSVRRRAGSAARSIGDFHISCIPSPRNPRCSRRACSGADCRPDASGGEHGRRRQRGKSAVPAERVLRLDCAFEHVAVYKELVDHLGRRPRIRVGDWGSGKSAVANRDRRGPLRNTNTWEKKPWKPLDNLKARAAGRAAEL